MKPTRIRITRIARLLGAIVCVCLLASGPSDASGPVFQSASQASGSSSGGAPFDIRTVSTVVPLRTDNGGRALSVYRALIPGGLSMPAHPIVGVWLSELSAGRSNSLRPMDPADHWIEGAIEIRVRHNKEEGWYPILYPVTAEFWFQAGRSVGLPKRHATASITPDGQGWKAQATPSGVSSPSIVMDWQPGADTDPAATDLAFKDALDPLLVLNAPLAGPQLERVQYVVSPPSSPVSMIPGGAPAYGGDPNGPVQSGAVAVHLAGDTDAVQESDLPKIFPPGSSLADIVKPDQTVPGDYYFYAVDLTDTSAVIGSGGYGPRKPVTTPTRSGGHGRPVPRQCTGVRTEVLRLSRASLVKLRVYINGQRVAARILRGGRVSFRLRGHDLRAQRVRIVAETSRNRTVARNLTYRTCAQKPRGPRGGSRKRLRHM